MLLGLAGMCFRKIEMRLPQGGSCSAVISAACHGVPGDNGSALKAVQWGEVVDMQLSHLDHHEEQYQYPYIPGQSYAQVSSEDDVPQGGLRHCCFTSFPVAEPTEGVRYG